MEEPRQRLSEGGTRANAGRRGWVHQHRGWWRNVPPQAILSGAALVSVAWICAWVICTAFASTGGGEATAVATAVTAVAERGVSRSDPAISRFAARFYVGYPPAMLSRSAPVRSEEATADDTATTDTAAALPAPSQPAIASVPDRAPRQSGRRFARLAPSTRSAGLQVQHRNPAGRGDNEPTERVAEAATEQPTVFEKLFGKPTPSPTVFDKLFGQSPSKVALAYATPEAGVAGDGSNVTTGLYDRQTAVYDISAHKVYLADGATLEAHSGLGPRLDDPRYVSERNRGATPPAVYDLALRGRLFHGVRALRLTPVEGSKVFGRSGLLAHTYMLGPDGDSNGCVSFKDYDAFLQAYLDHKITRLAVVTHLD